MCRGNFKRHQTLSLGETQVKSMRGWCESFNIPEEIATDGGPQLTSKVFQDSLKAWNVRHRLSSAYYPHSNCRAELAVKTAKRLLRDNMGPGGTSTMTGS